MSLAAEPGGRAGRPRCLPVPPSSGRPVLGPAREGRRALGGGVGGGGALQVRWHLANSERGFGGLAGSRGGRGTVLQPATFRLGKDFLGSGEDLEGTPAAPGPARTWSPGSRLCGGSFGCWGWGRILQCFK